MLVVIDPMTRQVCNIWQKQILTVNFRFYNGPNLLIQEFDNYHLILQACKCRLALHLCGL